jgi:hypothetical protein
MICAQSAIVLMNRVIATAESRDEASMISGALFVVVTRVPCARVRVDSVRVCMMFSRVVAAPTAKGLDVDQEEED